MDSQNNSDQKIAAHLAKPFILPGQNAQPLSFRALPDGGMVVIASDGRKLWFTVNEVAKVCKELNLRAPTKPATTPGAEIPQLHEPDRTRCLTFVPGRTREGESELISLPPDLKYLEERVNDLANKRRQPRPRSTG